MMRSVPIRSHGSAPATDAVNCPGFRAVVSWDGPVLSVTALFLLLISLYACSGETQGLNSRTRSSGQTYGAVTDGVEGSWGSLAAGTAVADSVWGQLATPREIVTIGESDPEGPASQLLGPFSSMAFAEGRIYLLDSTKQIVEIFSFDGAHEGNAGRPGEGPGEYMQPSAVRTDREGHLWVRALYAVHEFSPTGVHVATHRTETRSTFADRFGFRVTDTGAFLLTVLHRRLGPLPLEQGWGVVVQEPGGDRSAVRPIPRPDFEEVNMLLQTAPEQSFFVPAPYYPRFHWAVTPEEAIVTGVSGTDTLEIELPDGMATVHLRLPGDPAEIADGEEAWHRARLASVASRALDVSGWRPQKDPFPDRKPYFEGIVPDENGGGVWVLRAGIGKRWPDCAEDAKHISEFRSSPCWSETYSMDAFSLDGEYLGSTPLPVGTEIDPLPVVRGNLILLHYRGDDGNPTARVYELQTPD